jgi:hypothetical protein
MCFAKGMKLPKEFVKEVAADFARADLEDPRRVRRVVATVARLARAPKETFPDAMGSDAALEGAYRIINNPHVTFDALLAPHASETAKRAERIGRVLVIHDTTPCHFEHGDPSELGYLNTGKAGFYAHISLVVSMEAWRDTLGVVYAETIHRPKQRKGGKRKCSGPETARWKDRESQRWIRGFEASAQQLSECELVIHVADREADSYQMLAEMARNGAHFVVRLNHDRREHSEADGPLYVKEVARDGALRLEREVPVSSRSATSAPRGRKAHPTRHARLARLEIVTSTVVIARPQYLEEPLPEQITLNVVHVREPSPPADQDPVEWFLYTTEPIEKKQQVADIVDIYRTRWTIEEFNKALKTGCLYEGRHFESKEALLNVLAMCFPIACSILCLRSRARTAPDSPATGVLTPRQLRVLAALGSYRLPENPTIQDALLAVAALGGHLKRNGPPGWLVLTRGFTKLLAYEQGWAAARRAQTCDLS